MGDHPIRAAEFFAGIGLVRQALESADVDVVWANDIEQCKWEMYRSNFEADHFVLGDVRDVTGRSLPDIELATASFPCTDLSLAGNRRGLHEGESSMFWEFARILREMGDRRPSAILLENVPGFATSNSGRDLLEAIKALNALGYSCDVLAINAAHFVPQSRLRLFIVGLLHHDDADGEPQVSDIRPEWVVNFMTSHRAQLKLHSKDLTLPSPEQVSFTKIADRIPPRDPRWWSDDRLSAFVASLAPIHQQRLAELTAGSRVQFRTAYRRTRHGIATWELRGDDIAGCLRTARGGSSKQAVVQAGRGKFAVRWMTAHEYASLQGAPSFEFGAVTENKALFGFGDAVCVPVISWIANEYLVPALSLELASA